MSRNVRIRMYRQGLGDCFLLSFPRSDGGPASDFHLLIDCGVITGSDPARLMAAVQDIFTTTNGHLDLLVGTHEHWDHLSGFNQARELFNQFKVDQVWLAWTEDPNNDTAQGLQGDRSARLAALRSAVTRIAQTGITGDLDGIRNVLGFFGEDAAPAVTGMVGGGSAGAAPAAPGARTTRDAIAYLAARQDARVHYCYPSKDGPLALENVDGVRVYVFGPPEDLKQLKMIDPTKKGKETYGLMPTEAEQAFYAAISQAEVVSPYSQVQDLSFPFDSFYQVLPDEAQNPARDDFFRQHYGFGPDDADEWRRIDNDWLNVTSNLALNLDSDTNNTSLVLAFELGEPGQGKVLLFAADAQVGNWLSWEGLSWKISSSGNAEVNVTAPDLMARTVLYKVGHHGSHNATLRTDGLELMVRDDLAAMIPVDHTMAIKKGWNMPFPDLYDRLEQKTRGRVMRIDTGLPTRQDAATLTDAEWQSFTQAASQTDLYIEFQIPLD